MASYRFNLISFLILALFLASCSSDDTSDAINQPDIVLAAETHLDVSYGLLPQQVYDIYLPEGRSSETTKTLILVHGGFWTSGDKIDLNPYVQMLQNLLPNYAIVNMNYVLATSSRPAFPNQFNDIDLLINKLTAQQDQLQILPEFGLIGVSSGAQLSLQYDYVYDLDNQVKVVGDVVGPTDFTDPFFTEQDGFENLTAYLVDESAYPPNTDFTVALSPVFHVSSTSSPTIMFYGEDDVLVPVSNAHALKTALNEMGIPNSLTFYPGGHGDWNEASFDDFEIKLKNFIQMNFEIL